jgi:hypothetical protein
MPSFVSSTMARGGGAHSASSHAAHAVSLSGASRCPFLRDPSSLNQIKVGLAVHASHACPFMRVHHAPHVLVRMAAAATATPSPSDGLQGEPLQPSEMPHPMPPSATSWWSGLPSTAGCPFLHPHEQNQEQHQETSASATAAGPLAAAAAGTTGTCPFLASSSSSSSPSSAFGSTASTSEEEDQLQARQPQPPSAFPGKEASPSDGWASRSPALKQSGPHVEASKKALEALKQQQVNRWDL